MRTTLAAVLALSAWGVSAGSFRASSLAASRSSGRSQAVQHGDGTAPHVSDLEGIIAGAIVRSPVAGATVALNATVASDGDFIQIALNNPSHAKSGDWVGLYPADADVTTTVPLKWTYCVPYIPTYETTGTGTTVFQVYGIRVPLVFHLFTGGTSKPVLVASSPALPFADYDAPLHPRVLPGAAGAASAGDALTVAWTVTTATANPRLLWGTGAAGEYPHSSPATTAQIARDTLCGAPATTTGWLDLGVTARAEVAGLAALPAGAVVHYALADDAHTTGLRDYSFVVPPAPGAVFPFHFTAFGDLGRGSWDDGVTWREYGQASRSTAQLLGQDVANGLSTFTHHFGDISYAVGYLQVWDEFLYMAQPFLSSSLYLIGVGNHESLAPNSPSNPFFGQASDSGGECTKVVAGLFPLPAPATSSAPYYSYAVGPVAVVIISSEHDFTVGSAQHSWLGATLAAVDRSVTPWLILTSHRPMYIDSDFSAGPTSDITVMNLLQTHVEPLMAQHKVSLGLYGHNHRLERISAAFANRTVLASTPSRAADGTITHVFSKPTATVHYVAGTGGAAYSVNDCRSDQAKGSTCTIPAWSEEVGFAHGYLRFVAYNSTDLAFEYVNSENATVVDRVHIVQDLSQPWVGPGTAASAQA